MVAKTKYIQEMLNKLDNGSEIVTSPDGNTTISRYCEKVCGKLTNCISVHHYGTLILVVAYTDCYKHISKNGRSFMIGEGAYSPTDARIINQVLDRYVGGYVAHSRKGEVIID